MISLDFKDEYELLALHNALMEAKFSENPTKKEIIASPYIANLLNNVCELLEKQYKPSRMDILRKRPSEYNAWTEWRKDPSMEVLKTHVLRHWSKEWVSWELSKKEEWLNNIVAPYILPVRDTQELMQLIENET